LNERTFFFCVAFKCTDLAGAHQNVWFSLSYLVTLGKILLIECNQWAPPWIQCNDQTASTSQCPKWPLKNCKRGFLMVLFISFLYCIDILRNLRRTQSSTVWHISLSFRLSIFMQIRRHGIIAVAVHLTHLMIHKHSFGPKSRRNWTSW